MSNWQRNETWYKEVWLIVLTLVLVFSMLIGLIGWVRYKDEHATVKEQQSQIADLQRTLNNVISYESIE